MAIFHLTAKVISRGKGQSAIAAAAYRSGERLRDEQANEQKLYETRAERIQFTAIMAPKDAPEWAYDRNRLWNEAERAEKRKDAQLAREIEVALPCELTDTQRQWLVKDFAREAFVRKGFAVDIAIHAPDKNSDDRNHHAHLMVTRRTLGPDGFSPKKDWQFDPKQLAAWREHWADLANRHLERHGHEARIDHRSLEAQGIDREPTVHVGYAGTEMAARGAQSDRMDALQAVLARNDIRVEIKALDGELAQLEKLEREQGVIAAQEVRQERHDAAFWGRQERRDAAFWGQQEAWRASVEQQQSPDQPKAAGVADKGLQVVDQATGAASKLTDYVTDLLAGPSAKPKEPKADVKAYVSDPAARKEQQLARLAASQKSREDAMAIERIARDMEAGKNLNVTDIRALTQQHQEQIKTFGDDAVRQMVDEARKRSEQYWKGNERERE